YPLYTERIILRGLKMTDEVIQQPCVHQQFEQKSPKFIIKKIKKKNKKPNKKKGKRKQKKKIK
ncbi:hypothetical protein VPJ68_03820, partial [Parabacteroides distasonis]